jgi:hypothetical protein
MSRPAKCESVYSRPAGEGPFDPVSCGEAPDSGEMAVGLIRDAGFDRVDAARLRAAWYTKRAAPLVMPLAHEGDGGQAVADLVERFGEQA